MRCGYAQMVYYYNLGQNQFEKKKKKKPLKIRFLEMPFFPLSLKGYEM